MTSFNEAADKFPVERLREVFSYDPNTGILRWRISPSKRFKAGDIAGSPSGDVTSAGDRYLSVVFEGIPIKVHRVCFALHHGRWPSGFVDHENRKGSDNRAANLRECSRRENAANRPKRRAGLKGCSFDRSKGRWRASISVGGKTKSVGTFADEASAHEAYKVAAQAAYGKFSTSD